MYELHDLNTTVMTNPDDVMRPLFVDRGDVTTHGISRRKAALQLCHHGSACFVPSIW